MEWAQCFTIIGAIAPLFFLLRKDMQIMEQNHRDDMKAMDHKWTTLFGLYIEQIRNK